MDEWISVKDRLPESDVYVFVFLRNRDGYRYKYAFARHFGRRWIRSDNRYFVTHWMPLPEPPKEVEDG